MSQSTSTIALASLGCLLLSAAAAACGTTSVEGGPSTTTSTGSGGAGTTGMAGGQGATVAAGGQGGASAGQGGNGSGGHAGGGGIAAKPELGDPCDAKTACPAGGSGKPVCLTDWPSGYCAVDGCEQHGHDCPNDPGQGSDATTGGKCVKSPGPMCLALCATNADCRDGYECAPRPDAAGHGSFKVCVPKSGMAGGGGMGSGGGDMGSGGGMMEADGGGMMDADGGMMGGM